MILNLWRRLECQPELLTAQAGAQAGAQGPGPPPPRAVLTLGFRGRGGRMCPRVQSWASPSSPLVSGMTCQSHESVPLPSSSPACHPSLGLSAFLPSRSVAPDSVRGLWAAPHQSHYVMAPRAPRRKVLVLLLCSPGSFLRAPPAHIPAPGQASPAASAPWNPSLILCLLTSCPSLGAQPSFLGVSPG